MTVVSLLQPCGVVQSCIDTLSEVPAHTKILHRSVGKVRESTITISCHNRASVSRCHLLWMLRGGYSRDTLAMCPLLRVPSVPLLLPAGEALSGAPFLQSGVQRAASQVSKVCETSIRLALFIYCLHCISPKGEGVLSCWCQESGGQGFVCRCRGSARSTLAVWRPRW